MAKRRRGQALFDLLAEDKEQTAQTLQTPAWWKRSAPDPVQTKRTTATKVVAAKPGEGVEPEPQPKESSAPTSVNDETIAQPRMWELDGDRIRLSLSSVGVAVVVFIALVALLGSYEFGRRRAADLAFASGYDRGREHYVAQAASEIEVARQQTPARHLIQGLLLSPPGADSATDEAAKTSKTSWVRGHTYVVAQEFPSGYEEDAVRAQTYLARNGIAVELIRYPSGSIQLITRQGYNRTDPAQGVLADRLRDRVQEVGVAFFASGGRYRLEGYFRTLKGDRW